VAKLHSKDIELGLDRFQALLQKLGHPQDDLPPVIHVAGTNGKGSTIAFLRSCLEAVGYVVHAFTSPHLIRPNESIVLGSEEIGEDQLLSLLNEVIEANDGAPLTVFEAITAAAFLGFSRTKAHVVLLETGMGGLGDTTNVVEKPALCAITPISLDHQEFLGETLLEIASHKAGILKAGVPCVLAKQEEEAYQSVREQAKALDVPLYREGREWFVKKAGQSMIFEGWDGDFALPLPGLEGEHQVQNVGVAMACLQVLKDHYNLPLEAIRNGVQDVEHPGRLERIDPEPYFESDWELWLDGGHNEGAAKVLRQQVKKWSDKPLYVVFGMLKRKNSKAFLKEFSGKVDHVYTVPIPKEKSKKPEKLAGHVQDAGGVATACEDLSLALELIRSERKKPGRVLICGSLYLLGAFYDLSGRA
jgi:dihydrofolate synthase/folylpolyglutamate synthase